MIDSYFRSTYQNVLVDPVVSRLAQQKITPNGITLCACLVGIGFAPAMWLSYPYLAATLLLISGYLDTLDGSLARHTNSSSDAGAILDIVCDRIVEFAAVLGLFFYAPQTRAMPCLLILGSFYLCITTFLVVGIFESNDSEKSFHYSPGLIERTEAMIFFILAAVFENNFFILAAVFSVLVFLTAFIRLFQGFLRHR